MRSQYQAFIEDFSLIRPSTGEACFRMQTLLVHAWRKFPFLDPDLPAELLPSDWSRRRAHELFTGRHSAWSDPARVTAVRRPPRPPPRAPDRGHPTAQGCAWEVTRTIRELFPKRL